ncbi:PVC-type heme-binding CxxCH protein [Pirellulaceae bacterium SH467]
MTSLPLRAACCIVGLFCSATVCPAQTDSFPEVYNSERDRDALPMGADAAAEGMKLPPGFRASVFASEPDVQNPIAMTWDTKGRLWVAENYTYSERGVRFDLSLRDRVLIFQDLDGDGRAESRRVFVDNVQMLTSVEVGRGGVWLMCPPQLLFVPDTDENGVADGPAQVVLDGFEVAQDNYHNFANGLKWGPDGWLYGRCGHSCPGKVGRPGTPLTQRIPIDGGIWRYSPETKVFEGLCHGTTNPWGHDWDAKGELFFINTVIGHLWHLMPGSHLKESFGESMNPRVYERLDMIADHYHFDTGTSWSDSRDGKANDLGGGHAHIGAAICLDSRWPDEYRHKLFTLNMHGRRANVERLERTGAGFVGRHEPDFLVAADPFFRGLDLQFGPDGALYVIDWSDTGECHDSTGVHRTSGRIFRIAMESERANASVRKTASSSVSFAKPACAAGDGFLQKLWRSYRGGELSQSELLACLEHPDESVRVWGIRLLTDRWPLDTILGPKPDAVYPEEVNTVLPKLLGLSKDSSGLVLSTLASTLQRLPVDRRIELASRIAARDEFANDRDLPGLVWFGLVPVAEQSPDALLTLAFETRWRKLQRWVIRSIAEGVEDHPQNVEQLCAMALHREPGDKDVLLQGWRDAFRGLRKVAAPPSWDRLVASDRDGTFVNEFRELSVIFGSGKALDELRSVVLDGKAEMKMRQQALASIIDANGSSDNSADRSAVLELCEKVLDTRILNGTALAGFAKFDDEDIGVRLARKLKRFQPEDRSKVIEVLVSRKSYAKALLQVMEDKSGPVSSSDLQPFQARQILALEDESLAKQLEKVWGGLRETNQERTKWIEDFRTRWTETEREKTDLSRGRALFEQQCSQCHKLYGIGAAVGPDLTGAQRMSLDYLLENIVEPSAVVGKDYRMTLIRTEDGRTVSGLVVRRNAQSVMIQTPTSLETIALSDIEEEKLTSLSPMPDGILQNLSWEQQRDLLAYLMHPTQVPGPGTER